MQIEWNTVGTFERFTVEKFTLPSQPPKEKKKNTVVQTTCYKLFWLLPNFSMVATVEMLLRADGFGKSKHCYNNWTSYLLGDI